MGKIGIVTEKENREIKEIFGRKMALEELIVSIQDIDINTKLYNKLIEDIMDCNTKMKEWWKKTAKAHEWSYTANQTWNVDFDSREVNLVDTQQ